MRTHILTDAPEDGGELLFPVRLPPQSSFTRAVEGTTARTKGGGGDNGGTSTPGGSSGGGPGKRKRYLKVGGWLMLALWGTAAVGVIAYAARKDIAREVAQGWLRSQDIPSELRIDALGFNHVSGRVMLGEAGRPDLKIERFDIDYELNLLRFGQPLTRIKRIHLVKPELTFSYDKKGLGFGRLDRILKSEGGGGGGPLPEDILVEDARIKVRTDYGAIAATGGVSLKGGRLRALDAKLVPGELNGPLLQGQLSDGHIRIQAEPDADAGEALRIDANLSASDLVFKAAEPQNSELGDPATRLSGAHADLDLRLPYRKLSDEASRKSPLSAFDGVLSGILALRADTVEGAMAVEGLDGTIGLNGRVDFENTRVAFSGKSQVMATLDGFTRGNMQGRAVRLTAQDLTLRSDLALDAASALTLDGPLSLRAGAFTQAALALEATEVNLDGFSLAHGSEGTDLSFEGRATAGRVVQGDLTLAGVNARLDGTGRLGDGGYEIALTTDVAGRQGSYRGMGALAADRTRALAEGRVAFDAANARLPAGTPPVPAPPEGPDLMVALTRAADRFSLKADDVRITLSGQGPTHRFAVRPGKPVLIRPLDGGEIRLTTEGRSPLIASDARSTFSVVTTGDNLPPITARIYDFGFGAQGALDGRLSLEANFNFAPVYGAAAKAHGRFVYSAAGVLQVRLDDCVPFTTDRADIGGRMSEVSARLCPTSVPILTLDRGQWRSEGRFDGLQAAAPDYQVTVAGGEGTFTTNSFAEGLGFNIALKTLTATDALEAPRFHPVTVNGAIAQGRQTLDGKLLVNSADAAVQARAAGPLAEVVLRSDVATGTGRADITAINLTFAPQALQPLDLTPMVAGLIQRDTVGKVDFNGYFGWSRDGSTSGGVLTLNEMGFTGPAGLVEGLNGRIDFTSLAPLHSAPGQTLTARTVTSVVPLKDVKAVMQFAGDYLKLESARVTSEGGDFALAPMDVPFDVTKGFKGELSFDKVDFGKVVASSPFARDAQFTGFVSGKLPFEFAGGKLAVRKGYLLGEGPGRVSIRRNAVTDMSADGAGVSNEEKAVAAPEAPPPNVVEGLAYQAMENLAYQELSAAVNTDDKGLLNFNFRIVGRYDPPERKEARIGLIDYLRGTWTQKPIDLPSDTQVNLNLDVNYNLDEFLKDYIEVQKRGGFDWSQIK
ncbi:YdbH domain-containing protein [Asticcacaulis sp. AND118]|uniref:intermembrane phospholipid transport protein YdbH family protein n=1 Tax=Asticcacaulis sp. AND118 TaxID=2840468 RepID=UPI001CFFA450|nr:YdbH domain-containing protein [Asticcacaulis sp. AND118]UDF04262.1 YdbH domain-containing protein [Asticcacaulis sp. AND118]